MYLVNLIPTYINLRESTYKRYCNRLAIGTAYWDETIIELRFSETNTQSLKKRSVTKLKKVKEQ